MTSNDTIAQKVLGLRSKKATGFTLIELLIVIAIIGILAGIGYPSYTAYVLKTHRTDGTFSLMRAVQAMERCKSTQFSYANCTLAITESPEAHYTVALSPAATASTFTVVATSQGIQLKDTDCASMAINHLGVKISTEKDASEAATTDGNECWM